MKDGQPDGLLTAWDENGSKLHEVRYKGSYRSFDATDSVGTRMGKGLSSDLCERSVGRDHVVRKRAASPSEKNLQELFPDGTWVRMGPSCVISITSTLEKWPVPVGWSRWTFMSEDEKRCEILLKDGSGDPALLSKNGTVFHLSNL